MAGTARALPLDGDEDDIIVDITRADRALRERGVVSNAVSEGFQFEEPSIIPFNLTATQGVSLSQEDTEEEEALFDMTPPMLTQLKEECGTYMTGLEHALADSFSNENQKLARRLKETKTIPLTFLYMRTLQAALKETGHLDVQREKRILFNLQDLYETAE
eukprot:TRINITY_DN2379_c1_g3_i1.p1 TRINITY_DN2379_c1_g3~~TRINITY_DN2379_c1_g3_i1.p1  ORF type:complete len:180 (+),score=85.03 TRINITY_DN2379_c1_g3_i1:60-542(+)